MFISRIKMVCLKSGWMHSFLTQCLKFSRYGYSSLTVSNTLQQIQTLQILQLCSVKGVNA